MQQLIDNGTVDPNQVATSMAFGAAFGAVSGGMAAGGPSGQVPAQALANGATRPALNAAELTLQQKLLQGAAAGTLGATAQTWANTAKPNKGKRRAQSSLSRPAEAPPGFSDPKLGQQRHNGFRDEVCRQTGTFRRDWKDNSAPGKKGVDLTYVGPPERNPGFEHAELTPRTWSGFWRFIWQWQKWLDIGEVQEGQTSLWWYDENGEITNTGHRY